MTQVMTILVDYKLIGFMAYTGVLVWGVIAGVGFYHVMKVIIKGLTGKGN